MNYAKISQVAHYAPRQVVSNDDLAEIMDTSDEWISSRTGIKNRHLSSDETTSDLATKVAENLLQKSGTSAQDLDFIIVATITPDLFSKFLIELVLKSIFFFLRKVLFLYIGN